MKMNLFFRSALALLCGAVVAGAQVPDFAGDDASAAVQEELRLVRAVRDAAKRGDDAVLSSTLATAGRGVFGRSASSVAIARRAAMACGELRNENDYVRASKLASRAIEQLAKLEEATDSDRAERLYWEAWMEANVLDQKLRAIELLRAAEKIAPEDERILELQLRLVSAVAEFGR